MLSHLKNKKYALAPQGQIEIILTNGLKREKQFVGLIKVHFL